MDDWLGGFRALPAYGAAGLALLLVYGLQAEIRFGTKARSHSAGPADRGSSMALKAASLIVVGGFVLAMKAPGWAWVPRWFPAWTLPWMPEAAWCGVAIGVLGFLLRLWSVFTLRERYTRTLLTQDRQEVERKGPYRWVRHPGYLGSLMALNGLAMSSGNAIVLLASVAATGAAYAYRIRAEDRMLLGELGESYAAYRREVPALIPFVR